MKPQKEQNLGTWIEVTFVLPRDEARLAAKDYYKRYLREGYETHIVHWHVTDDGKIFFSLGL